MSTPIDPQPSRQVGPKQPSHNFSFAKHSDPLLRNITNVSVFPLKNTATLSRIDKYPNRHKAVQGKSDRTDRVFREKFKS